MSLHFLFDKLDINNRNYKNKKSDIYFNMAKEYLKNKKNKKIKYTVQHKNQKNNFEHLHKDSLMLLDLINNQNILKKYNFRDTNLLNQDQKSIVDIRVEKLKNHDSMKKKF